MRIAPFAAIALMALAFSPVAANADPAAATFSSQVRVGPDGVQIGPGHRRSESREDRRRADRRECRRLQRACERGPRGEGNCARYRRICG